MNDLVKALRDELAFQVLAIAERLAALDELADQIVKARAETVKLAEIAAAASQKADVMMDLLLKRAKEAGDGEEWKSR